MLTLFCSKTMSLWLLQWLHFYSFSLLGKTNIIKISDANKFIMVIIKNFTYKITIKKIHVNRLFSTLYIKFIFIQNILYY